MEIIFQKQNEQRYILCRHLNIASGKDFRVKFSAMLYIPISKF